MDTFKNLFKTMLAMLYNRLSSWYMKLSMNAFQRASKLLGVPVIKFDEYVADTYKPALLDDYTHVIVIKRGDETLFDCAYCAPKTLSQDIKYIDGEVILVKSVTEMKDVLRSRMEKDIKNV